MEVQIYEEKLKYVRFKTTKQYKNDIFFINENVFL